MTGAGQRFEAALSAYRSGRTEEAVRLLNTVLQVDPRSAPAHHLLGLCLSELREFDGAEKALRTSLSLDKRRPAVHASLGSVLHLTSRPAEAEKAFRAGLALDRRHVASVLGLAELLLAVGRPTEALQTTTPLAAAPDALASVLNLHAQALKSLGRLEEALGFNQRAVGAGGPFGELEVAGTLRELGRYEAAEAAARRAFAAGDHPATWVVLGRVLQDLARYQEAEAAYREALTRAPLDPTAHMSLAELLWARTADPAKASVPLDSVLSQRPTAPLLALKAKLLSRAGKPGEAYAIMADAARHAPDDPLIQASAATAAAFAGDVEAGLAHAEKAHALVPGVPRVCALLAETCLAAGQPDRAAALAIELLKDRPHDQQYLALQTVAWRLMGDQRYREAYDYDSFVCAYTLPTPEGWRDLPSFLSDLAGTLKGMHAMRGDPLDQSLRNGTQTEQNLVLSPDPVLRAFFKAAEAPIAAHVAKLGKGKDPLRARNTGTHRIKAGWSVRLKPNGFHADHLHPDGWLSSAFYVELPKAVEAGGREGWLKFGQPGTPTRPALEPEHFIKPEPGLLVLFPSYMWHGTVPFTGDETRLTMAFDVVPGR